MVFPPIWGGKSRRSEHAHASYSGLSFRQPGFSPHIWREERRVQGLDYLKPYLTCFSSLTRWESRERVYHEATRPVVS